MKIKNKGKVYPSPSPSSSSSSSSSSANGDYLSGLKLLPAAIIALATVLPLEDREVLAYLITRSIKTTATTSSSSIIQRKSSKKTAANGSNNNGNGSTVTHKPPVFDCDCFDCYTSYWFRWDSSPNRELIHQAIEAFEDHLTNGEAQKSKKNGKAKRRDKTARRFGADNNNNQVLNVLLLGQPESSVPEKQVEDSKQPTINVVVPDEAFLEDDVAPVNSPTKEFEENEVMEFSGESKPAEDETTTEVMQTTAAGGSCNHKGLARKVLPDVLGLFNSRLWSLWSPNA
ncbi:uncharacterized protein LOC116131272 [Pistacia vera]|uniref:uncharacterized protein LOC116118660 n=1 Tax=Pistacia vera TaxID=55513 RepID=UPI001262AFDC|nr:uncharacterized protein LOC116118660 [Pistacia vera]XP_031272793.1 uncharacterized protein LOC116131272 [Pistacia vera]